MQTSPSIRALSLFVLLLTAGLPVAAQTAAQTANQTAEQPAHNPVLQNSAAAPDPTPPPAATSPKPKEVNLLAIVLNKKGEPVNTLEKQDFVLEQDGHAQTISQLERESSLPLTVGVLAETAPGERRALADERKAGADFLKHLLRPGSDHGFVLHFDREVELLQDVTGSQDKLARGIDEISAGEPPRSSIGGPGRGPASTDGRDATDPGDPQYHSDGSMLYDAIFLSANEVLKGQQGRKAVVLFSDGVDRESKSSLLQAIEAAQRAKMLVYCVYAAPERGEQEGSWQRSGGGVPGGGYPGGGYPRGGYPGGGYPGGNPGGGPIPGGGYPGGGGPFPGGRRGPESSPQAARIDGKKILQQIAGESGGRYFELSKKLSAGQIYAQIEDELRHQSTLSYTPDVAESGYHSVHAHARSGELTVRTQAGFYEE